MKQILWFRRDLRIEDNAILAHATGTVMPIFIFDTNILEKLPPDDKRISFIYHSVLTLQTKLRELGLDLYIFHGKPIEIFKQLQEDGFDVVLASCDFDSYAKQRDEAIEKLIPMKQFFDSWLVHPLEALKKDGTPYKVFTPFYKSLSFVFQSTIEEFQIAKNLELLSYNTPEITLQKLGFSQQNLPEFLYHKPLDVLHAFQTKVNDYATNRDFFYLDGTSNLSVFLRFGLLSPKQILNVILGWKEQGYAIEVFQKELFWREFYNVILYHFASSEFENFNGVTVAWRNNEDEFQAWCAGKTGIAIVDAAMRCLNQTGLMPNRLRMVVASFLTKNLLVDWRWGESYFASKLLDYEASSNIGSWQWAASTGADAVPYFRVFNPQTQNEKFDPHNVFIRQFVPKDELLMPMVDLKFSAKRAIEAFKAT